MDLLQTIGVGCKVRRAGLHSALKMGPKGGEVNADTGSSANDRLIMNSTRLALEAASLQGVEDENAHVFNNACD